MTQKTGLFIQGIDEESAELGRKFMDSPEAFAEANGLDPTKLDCPPEAHAAMDRADALGKDVNAAEIGPDSASMQKLEGIVSKHFGSDYDVSLIPFGLKFRENIGKQSAEWTATGSGTITFRGTDSDVDG